MNGININYRFPYELLQFILSKSGNSLLIKGPPGGGKTTISLQILETLQGKGNIVYLSTRVGDTSLYQQFPWLKDLEKNLKIIIASKIILESISEVEEEEKEIVQYGKKFLQEITGEGPKNVSRVEYKKILKDKKAPEIKRIYDNVEMNLPNKSIIVIDSIEGITSRYGIAEDVFVTMIQKDLVESVNTSVIFISEKYNVSPEDYIVDGVIYLNHEIDDGRRKRTLRINKLRGVEILQSSYAYTLKDGKFFTFYPEEYEKREITKFEFIKNEDNISTGIEDLDKILGGGLKPSSIF
ncbi:MAG: gas vesicle protein GvpD P-loop domain-containing protein, partial [Thermoplasmata archaeon]